MTVSPSVIRPTIRKSEATRAAAQSRAFYGKQVACRLGLGLRLAAVAA
jgi:hypothetical protein